MNDAPIIIGPAQITHRDGVSRIVADVDGHPVWFETQDVELKPNPEVWASAFFVPSLHLRRPLRINDKVDAAWMEGLGKMIAIYERWWETPDRLPDTAGVREPSARPQGTGLFFTCGIDSFHGMLSTGHDVSTVVNVQGFDVALTDTRRLEDGEAAVRDVARELNIKAIVVRTNLRSHPLMQEVNWEHTHGGALAAVGHALRGYMGKLLVASSFPMPYSDPWGSHWMTDSLWSTSDLEFEHVGADSDRVNKIREISKHAIILPHLRVCYEHPDKRINCSRCEKCLFTMLCLKDANILDECTTFDDSQKLLERLEAMPAMRWRQKSLKRLWQSEALDPEFRRVTKSLWKRSVWRRSPVRQAMHRVAIWMGMAREPDLTADQLKDARARARYRDSE